MKQYLIYMNWDGFGRYYFDCMPDRETRLPTLTSLLSEGTFFENARTGIPSITFPMQSSIVSGCYSQGTGNCDKFWDRQANEIRPLGRFNRAETIGEVLRRQQIPFVSIQQFALQDKGAETNNPDFLYLQPGGDFQVRFQMLDQLLLEKRIQTDTGEIRFQQLPQAIFAYMDDLDTVGHNPPWVGALTEEQRVAAVHRRLCAMDQALARTIAILKQIGIYSRTYFLLTTDHGMISYRGPSKMPLLRRALEQMGCGRVEVKNTGSLKNREFDVLLTSHDIQCQVYFKNRQVDQQAIRRRLLELPFVEQVLTREQLDARGVCAEYADMVVSPVEGMCFSTGLVPPGLHATHDSLHPKCQWIFAYLGGPGIRCGYRSEIPVQNIDFLPALCRRLQLPIMGSAAPTQTLSDIFIE